MASSENKKSPIRSPAQIMSFGTISTAAPPAKPPLSPFTDREMEEQTKYRNKETRFLDIDLNVAPPVEEEEELVNSNEIRQDNTTVFDYEESTEERQARNRRWEALLEVAEMALRELEYEEQKSQTRRRNRDKSHSESTRVRISTGPEMSEIVGTSDFVVARSTRKRAVAMPNKYRDSVIEPAADLSRIRNSDKSVASKRKSRFFVGQ